MGIFSNFILLQLQHTFSYKTIQVSKCSAFSALSVLKFSEIQGFLKKIYILYIYNTEAELNKPLQLFKKSVDRELLGLYSVFSFTAVKSSQL